MYTDSPMNWKCDVKIGTIEGIILTIDLARNSYISATEIGWLIRDSALSLSEMKKYNKELLEQWKEDTAYWGEIKSWLDYNEERYGNK